MNRDIIARIIASITLAMHAATFSDVLSSEHRLSKLETLKEIRDGKTQKESSARPHPERTTGEERAL